MKRIAAILLLFASGAALAEETLLGAGLRTRPEYEGSRERTVDLIPVVRYYGQPWFARTTQGILEGGARLALAQGLNAGAQLAYEAGPLDKDPGASAGLHLEWDWRNVSLLGRTRHHLGSSRGTQADARLVIGVFQGGGVRAAVYGQATWADAENTFAYYALRRDGWMSTRLGALGSWDLSRKWVLVGSVERVQLDDALRASPFVQRRSGTSFSAGLAYRL